MDAKEQLKALIEKYIKYKKEKKAKELSEESTRSWINEFLRIFDWDVLNIQQVQQEKIVDDSQKEKLGEISSSHTKPDYSLMNGTTVKAYLDAKKIDVDIFKNKEAAFQVRSYGWSAGLPCSFLTNFEQLVVFDCRYAPQKGEDAGIAATQISIDHYVSRFDELNSHFNRLLVYGNNLQKLYSSEKVEGSKTLDSIFNKLLSDFRLQLANALYANNTNLLDEDELNYYVQIILDRIVFIRVCESRKIEKEGLLLEFLKNDFWDEFKKCCYVDFYNHYDGAMFSRDEKFGQIILSNDVFEPFINKLYYPYPYKFDVIPTKVIAKIYEEFLAYSLRIKNGVVVTELKEDYVKTNGAIPTQEFIADAICKETVQKKAYGSYQDILSTKVLDPCCGSGVFLLSTYETFAGIMMNLTSSSNKWCVIEDGKKYLTITAKQEIMKNCLFGIDCDPTAVEVTKMSLALKVVDDTNELYLNEIGAFGEKILRNIHNNIKIGNTLVDIDISCNATEIKYIRPLNIKGSAFKKVFDDKGGFDYVVGNPPYVETKHFKAASLRIHDYLHDHYKTFEGKVDLSVLFIERTMGLLNSTGKLGMIIQRRWFKTNYGKAARSFIMEGYHLHKLLDIETNALFKGRITYVSIMILTKEKNTTVQYDLIPGDVLDVQLYFDNLGTPDSIPADYFLSPVWAPEQKAIFEIKNKYAKKYGTVGENENIDVCDGIQALWKKAYDIVDYQELNGVISGKNGFGDHVDIEKEMVKPVVYNREFLPLREIIPDTYRIFPYTGNDYKTKISIKKVQEKYPLAYKYLERNKKLITDKVRHNDGEYWHTYTREHNHDSFESPKIIVPMTTKETYATFVADKGLYMDNSNVWFLNYRGNNEIVMKALTMIINSTLFSVFGKSGANPANNGYYKFNKQFIEPIPLPNEKISPSNSLIIKLVGLYDEIKSLLEEYDKSNMVDKKSYRNMMEAKWQEVDICCMDLYEIEDDERMLINRVGRIESRIPGGDEE
jgi:type IIS restriction enzyme eco57I